MAAKGLLEERELVFDAFRRWGYLEAELDPLGFFHPLAFPELAVDGPAAEQARGIYCGSIGAEFMHIPDPEVRRWVQERMEADSPAIDREWVLERLVRADTFEQVMQAHYIGTKRFSLEGTSGMIPLLDEALETAAANGAERVVLAMSHRGRLNLMLHIIGRSAADIFAGFEDVDPRSVLGGGDVKYHHGATGHYETRGGRRLAMHMVSNPSHLEAVDPVAMGRARARQSRLGADGPARVLPVVLHGDAAFAGQGIAAETINMANLEGYTVGGTLHVVGNNLIGFTTGPAELHSSRFASDVARRLPVPIFHVNGEDPEALVRVGRIAAEFRHAFHTDVFVDVIGYRRHGHSEIDDPTITQPVLYARIKEHPPLSEIYAERIGADPAAIAARVREELEAALEQAGKATKAPRLHELPPYWGKYKRGRWSPAEEVDTGVEAARLAAIGRGIASYPGDFAVHPKVKRLLDQREAMGRGAAPVDYGTAEAFAFGTLLLAGTPVRLAGEDSRRGTFNQRHAVLFDTRDEHPYIPLDHLAPDQARFEIWNSPLSEAGGLGFEYGYSRDYPEALVLWEAQFGDFANGGQVIIDQFIVAAEDKWDLPSGLALLLPHGYEGQGPEHSSGRIERFLQLAARDNIQVCQPSSAAQYFHLLRRQALRMWRKPLVVFTPKSMLRHPDAVSPLADFTRPRFLNVVPDAKFSGARRVLVATGKIGHELRAERRRRADDTTAIVFLDQLYPFPEEELAAELARHPQAREVVWVQEEPANMGALSHVLPRLRRMAANCVVRSVKRSAAASPATGSGKAHEMEQKAILTLAFAPLAG
ncbi:MAG TPA: 2-oxoglutarate dehydrogenase E1 component [Candidatus Acidoferrales bacterium]|nr:2-oxoglutarate dehydrogenase E1 component [Candidatus Acidoferrales bacterium]